MKTQISVLSKQINNEKLDIGDRIVLLYTDHIKYFRIIRISIEIYWNIRHRLFDRFDLINTKLSKHKYHDKPEIILHGLMELLVDYVEVEKCFDIIDWSDNESVAYDIYAIYTWWKQYPEQVKECDAVLELWHSVYFANGKFDINALNKTPTPKAEEIFAQHTNMEAKLIRDANTMLNKIINIREYLWT